MVSRDDYERALERAKKLGVEICARGWRRDDGSRVIGVTSASEDGRVHLVTVRDLSLECDCLGFQNDAFVPIGQWPTSSCSPNGISAAMRG